MATLKEILQLHHQFIFQYFLRLITILIQLITLSFFWLITILQLIIVMAVKNTFKSLQFPKINLDNFAGLGCGIWATTLTAFYNEKQVNFWAYIIFGIYITFTLWILASIFQITNLVHIEMQSRSTPLEKYPIGLNNMHLVTSGVTAGIFAVLLGYNSDVLSSETTVNYPYAVFGPTLLGFRLFWPHTQYALIPCALFIPWIDLGCGFTVTIWAAFYIGSKTAIEMWIGYGIFGAQCVFAGCLLLYHFNGIRSSLKSEISITKISIHPAVLVSATGTTICFWVVLFYDVIILGYESATDVPLFFYTYLLFFFEQNTALLICALIPQSLAEINEENDNGNVAPPVLV